MALGFDPQENTTFTFPVEKTKCIKKGGQMIHDGTV